VPDHVTSTGLAAVAVSLLLLATRATVAVGEIPTVQLGAGKSFVIEYNENLEPVRKYAGLQLPSDITPLADGSLLLVDRRAHRIVQLDPAGRVVWSDSIVAVPQRVRPLPGGGLLVTGVDDVVATDAARKVVWRLSIGGLKVAVPLRNGNFLTATNDRNGWLREVTRQGKVVWQSKPLGHTDEAGVWIDEDPHEFFLAVWSLDVAADGRILAADFERNEIRVLSRDYRVLRTIRGFRHMEDTRFGPNGEIVAVSPEDYRVLIVSPDGDQKSFATDWSPVCANWSADGRLFVGFEWRPEHSALYATEERRRQRPPVPWSRRPFPVSLLAVLLALSTGIGLRWPQISGRVGMLGPPRPDPPHHDREADMRRERTSAGRLAGVGACLALLAAGGWLAWQGIVAIEATGFTADAWHFGLGCLLGGVALRLLNVLAASSSSLTSFYPAAWPGSVKRPDRPRTAIVLALGLASLAVCIGVLLRSPADEAVAVGAWLAAQLWLLFAAFPAIRAASSERAPRVTLVLLGIILLVSIGTRFWQIGYYPDYVHHDHSMFGYEIVRSFRGDWQPFFSRIYSVGRPWFIPVLAGFELFGQDYWLLRLTPAVSGVVLTGGAYLLGKALFNSRVGVVAAFLICVNQLLLLYSRQPYVLDPAAPFVLSLYCAATGLRRGCRFHWCAAGVLSGWALLGYYASVTYVPVGAAILAYLVLFYPKTMWRQRTGIVWFLAGGVFVYLPMLAATLSDSIIVERANSLIVFLNPDGSIRWDAALWAQQVGRSFGAILRAYGGDMAWGVSARESMCMRYGACLFGMGLVYLLTVWRTPAAFLLLVWGSFCIFFGSAMLPGAPTSYHFLAAVVPVMLASAVTVDRGLALTDRWPRARVIPLASAAGLLSVIGYTHLGAVWKTVQRPADHADGSPRYDAQAPMIAARYVAENPDHRYYLVRTRVDQSSASAGFKFFVANSDISDITTDLRGALPVPPVEPASGASFLVLPSRAADAEIILEFYPNAARHVLHTAMGGDVLIYTVAAEEVREVYGVRGRAGDSRGDSATSG
jgi:hypothetical protein